MTDTTAARKKDSRPNVIVILADDMGHGDVSLFGNRLIETRHIDSIGRDGVKFTAGYSSAPLCSPSRAGLVTGRYQQRFGFEQQVSSGAYPERREVREEDGSLAPLQGEAEFLRRGIPTTEKLIGELFKAQGYRTGVIGKWHLGHAPQFQPQNRGFDHSCVFYGNTSLQHTRPEDPEVLSFKVDFHDEASDTAWTRHGLNNIRRNGELVDVDQYLMHFFRDEVLGFIERSKDQPFMLYFPMNSPVPPLQVPRAYFERLRATIPNIHQRAYNALVLAQDDVIGAVLDKLRALGLEENTFVVFVSDNGCADSRPGSNAPYSGGKYTTYEGGIRMPYVMKWPGRIQPGQVYSEPVSTLDIVPTVAAAGGVPVDGGQPLDGVNLLPYLQQQKQGAPHEALFWKLAGYSAVRVGPWKLYMEPKKGIAQLFHLLDDPQETTDLASAHPEVFEDLMARYRAWDQSLPPRAWTNISPVFKSKGALVGFDLASFLPHRLSLLSRLTQELLASQLQDSGVTVAQWRVYLCLASCGPSALNSVAAFTRLPQSSLSRSVAQMAERGLVRNERDAKDRRIARIALTPQGRKHLQALTRQMHAACEGVFGMDAQEEDAFLHTVNDLIIRLSEQLGHVSLTPPGE